MSKYLNMTQSKFNSHWKNLVFSGQGLEPRKLKTPEDVVKFVGKRKGAIGYIPSGVPHDGVKVIKIRD